jgi:hypothetical protein
MSSQRGRGFAHALARKCWVKKGKSLFLAPQACAYPAEREERNKEMVFDAGSTKYKAQPP